MNKLKKIILSILGACNVLIEVISPILLVFIWIKISGLTDLGSYILYCVGLLASTFRGIKFWIKEND